MPVAPSRFLWKWQLTRMTLMCVFGYSKIYVIFPMLYALQLNRDTSYHTSVIYDEQQNLNLIGEANNNNNNSDTDDTNQANGFGFIYMNDCQAFFFAGIFIGILSFIKFGFKHSRRYMILVCEAVYIAGLLVNQDYSNMIPATFVLFGASLAVSLVIFPLYLCEQSYDDENNNLSIFLCYSFPLGAAMYQTLQYIPNGRENFYVTIGISGFSILSGLLFNFGNSVKDTILKQYMCGDIPEANRTISKVIQWNKTDQTKMYFNGIRLRKYFRLPQGRKYIINAVYLREFRNQIPVQHLPILKKNETKKTIQMTFLAMLVPLAGAYYYQTFTLSVIGTAFKLNNSSDDNNAQIATSTDDSNNVISYSVFMQGVFVVALALFATILGLWYAQRKNHFKMFVYGFQTIFILSVIGSMEEYLQDQDAAYIFIAINYCRFAVMQATIEPIWKSIAYIHMNPNYICLQQLIYWLVFLVSYFNSGFKFQNVLQAAAGLIGYSITYFF